MIFYMIEDLNSGKWYKRGSCGGNWVDQNEASVWTTKAGPSSCLGNIRSYNKRARGPREPEIREINTDDAMEALIELVRTINLRELHPDRYADRWNFALASAQQVIAIETRSTS